MRLADFILQNAEAILVEWESFARSQHPVDTDISAEKLRDHAREMIEVIAADIVTDQTTIEQDRKSKGLAPNDRDASTAAGIHGTLRHGEGRTAPQVVAEFRALRTAVLKLWLPTAATSVSADPLQEMVRFNEAIDQAIAESMVTFSWRTDRTRDTFLAMLGHDLRSPLHAISLSAEFLDHPRVADDGRLVAAQRIRRSARLMAAMVEDLLEFARVQMGGVMPIRRQHIDIVEICEAAAENARSAHPACRFDVQAGAGMVGHFDSPRLLQVFGNLLNNAAQYRTKETPVTISAELDQGSAVVRVRNLGAEIPGASREAIFDPLVQLHMHDDEVERPRTSMGLGLFIAREIVEAHGGSIELGAGAIDETVFVIRLPLG